MRDDSEWWRTWWGGGKGGVGGPSIARPCSCCLLDRNLVDREQEVEATSIDK